MRKINLGDAFDAIAETGVLRTVAAVNDAAIKLGRFRGRFVWHRHDDEDELFWVIGGRLTLETRDGSHLLEAGEMLLVPRGCEHRTMAEEEAHVVVIHPRRTIVPSR